MRPRASLARALSGLALAAALAAGCTLPPFVARDAASDRVVPGDAPTDGPPTDALDVQGDIAPTDADDVTPPDASDVPTPPTDGGDVIVTDAPDAGPADAALRLLWVSITAVDSTELSAGGAALRDLRFETAARTCVGETCGSVGVRP